MPSPARPAHSARTSTSCHLQAYAGAAADGLEDLADYIDRTEVADIFDGITAFAKRQPVLAAAVTLASRDCRYAGRSQLADEHG